MAGELDSVLKAMTVLADQMGDNALMNDVVHLSERRRRILMKKKNGVVDTGEMEAESRRVSQALMLLVAELPEA